MEPLLKKLSWIERMALTVFTECWEQWETGGGGFTRPYRVCLPYERAESAARSHGLWWGPDLKGLIRRCQNFILKQQDGRMKEQADADEAARLAREAGRE